MKKFGLVLLSVFLVIGLALFINPDINPSHDTPYLALNAEQEAVAPASGDIIQRVLLFGDAGHSTLDPWQENLRIISGRASLAPEKTAVVALGDNIYFMGYPSLDDDQEEFDEGQLKSISYLDAQLKIASESGAAMYLVPGNHDWYASELEGQGQHISDYARKHQANVSLQPWRSNELPLPQAENLSGVSLIFLDSEWIMHTTEENYEKSFSELERLIQLIRNEYPGQLILVNAHHPMETMGQHAGYLTSFGYWFFIKIIYGIFDVDQDITHPNYQRYIAKLEETFAPYEKIIYASGHEHSLQVFGDSRGKAPQYKLVSGAGNRSKVSGVWHTDNTRFALSSEGFMELVITDTGVHLSVFDSREKLPVSQFWLDL